MRRRYLVDRRFQLRWAAMIALLGAAIAALLSATVWAGLDEQDHLLVDAVEAQRQLQDASENVAILLMNIPEVAKEEGQTLESRFAASKASLLAIQSTNQARLDFNRYLRYAVIAFIGLIFLALFVWGIVITHRVAGPMYVIKGLLEAHAAGEKVDFRPLRTKDEFKDVYEVLSRALRPKGSD